MPLVTTDRMFRNAYAGGYAIGAFNFNNMHTLQAIVEACREASSPVILQVSQDVLENLPYHRAAVQAASQQYPEIPMAWHLDHGNSFEICKACIDSGYTSVMIDASSRPFEENIAITRRVVEYAHDRGVTVEAELGALAGVEDDVNVSADDARYTHPEEVGEFVHRTGCDSLAVAIGTSHGAYKFAPGTQPRLRLDILAEIMEAAPGVPMVLHGASGVPQAYVEDINTFGGRMPGAVGIPDAELRRAAQMAVCKINVASDLRIAATAAIRRFLAEKPEVFDPRAYEKIAKVAMKQLVCQKLHNVMGSAGKAEEAMQ